MNKKHKILSLFANIGIAEAYFDEIGKEVVVANEIDPRRAKLYQAIYPKSKMICGDITDENVYKNILHSSLRTGVNVIMATPPCQGMSTAGQMKKMDPRNILFMYAIKLIKDIKPDYFLFENVPAFLTTYVIYNDEAVLIPDVIKTELSSDYDLDFSVRNAKDYGVPQSRERMILLATKKGVSKKWIFPPKDDKLVTMEDAIGWIPSIDPYVRDLEKEEFQKLFPLYESRKKEALKISKFNIPPKHVYRNVYAMQHTPTGQSAFKNIDKFKPKKQNGEIVRGFGNTYKRQNWDSPAYTIAMDNIEISSQNNVHPGRFIGKDAEGYDLYSDARAMTLFELMCLMTLPKNWPLPDWIDLRFFRRIIGEGVPSTFMKKIFMQI